MAHSSALVVAPPQALQADADALALLDEYREQLALRVRSGDLSPATQRTYELGLGRFVDYCQSHRHVDTNVVRGWVASLREAGLSAGTINTWLAGVRAFFGWAEGERRIPFNPAAGVKGARRKGAAEQHKRDALSDAEVMSVLARPDPSTPAGARDRAYLFLRAYTACRDIELHRANVEDLQTRQGRLTLNVQGKGHAEADAYLVITKKAEGALRAWLAVRGRKKGPLFTSFSDRSKGARLSLSAIRRMVKSYYQAAGITEDKKTSHSLRHAAITNAVQHGVPVQKAQRLARHASVETTMIYYHEQDRLGNPPEEFVRYQGDGQK